MQTILQLDYTISDFLAKLLPHNVFFNTFFSFLSLEGNWIVIWAIAVGVLFFTEIRQDRRFIVYFILSFVLTVVTTNILLKNTFKRHRPWVAQQLEASTCPRDYSFPSTHASGAFAGATIISAFDRKRRYLYFSTAFLISFSRVYLLCHYFFDIVTGGIIGYLISYLVLSIKIGKKPIE